MQTKTKPVKDSPMALPDPDAPAPRPILEGDGGTDGGDGLAEPAVALDARIAGIVRDPSR